MAWPKVAFKYTAQKDGLINLRHKPPQNIAYNENPNEYTRAEKSALLFLRAIMDFADAYNEEVVRGAASNGDSKEDGDHRSGGNSLLSPPALQSAKDSTQKT